MFHTFRNIFITFLRETPIILFFFACEFYGQVEVLILKVIDVVKVHYSNEMVPLF